MAERGNLKICQHIIDRFDDKNPKDLNEETPLHWAASKNHFEVCKLILENVSDRNPKDVRHITPLHMAAAAKNLELCKLILLNEVDENPRDTRGNTPLDGATSGSFDICKYILDKVSDKHPENIFPWDINGLDMCEHTIKKLTIKSPLNTNEIEKIYATIEKYFFGEMGPPPSIFQNRGKT